MNNLAEQPSRTTNETVSGNRYEEPYVTAQQPETSVRSFNQLASVNMLRYDLRTIGSVRPETREQVRNEQLSYLAEGVDRAACTEFVFRRQAGAMQYFKDGQWRPYDTMLMTGLDAAKADAAKDYRRNFLVDWASNDIYNALQMQKLRPGEQRVWVSSYPHQEAARYGTAFMRECGLNPDRKLGFIYRASCNEKGEIVLQSQTVDQSDSAAFAKVLDIANRQPSVEMNALVDAYDEQLGYEKGEKFYAGRPAIEVQQNAWEAIRQQHDLVDYLMTKLETIASSSLQGRLLETAVKRHVYGVWAAFKSRLDGKHGMDYQTGANYQKAATGFSAAHYAIVGQEVQEAFRQFASEGKMLVGCGGATFMMKGEASIFNASIEDVFNAVFGSKAKKESYKFDQKMFCVVCQAPPGKNESEKMCGPCGICKHCDAKFKTETQNDFALAA